MRRVAWFTAIVLATLTGVIVLWQFRAVLGLFVLSLVVAAAVRPVIDWLVQRRLPVGLAMLLVYLVGLGFVAGLLWLISPSLFDDIQRAANRFVMEYDRIIAEWPRGSMFQQMVAAQLPPANDLFGELAGQRGVLLAETALGVTLSLFDLVGQGLLILVLSLYWSADQVRFERLWLSLLPAERRARARTIWRVAEQGVGAYIRSELLQSLIAVLVLSVGYTIAGVEYPVLLAVVSAVLWLIPLVGGLLVLVVVGLVGLLTSPLVAGVAVVFTLVVLLLLEWQVEPRLFDRKDYNSILVLLVMIAMADAFGLLGLIVAPAFAVAIQIALSELTNPVVPIAAGTPSAVAQPVTATVTATMSPQIDQIRARLSEVRAMIGRMEQPSPRLISMANRLEELVKDFKPVAEEQEAVKQEETRRAVQQGGGLP
jgi:putative permease